MFTLRKKEEAEVVATCFVCKETEHVTVTIEDLERYLAGTLIQNVWPKMSPDQREVVISARTGFYMCGCDIPD